MQPTTVGAIPWVNVPNISVVIPTYNHRRFVLKAIDSVFAQTTPDYEVIVVNDGSVDDTAELLRPLAESGRIRYCEQPNRGQAAARNLGLSMAKGEFVALLDDDDYWPSDKLRRQVDALSSCSAALVGGWMQFVGEGKIVGSEWGPDPGFLTPEQLAQGCPFISPGQTLIRRSAIEQVGGFDPDIWGVDDYDLYLRLATTGPLLVDRRVSLYYRLHQQNASRQRDRMLANGLTLVRRHFPQRGSRLGRFAYRWLYEYGGRERLGRAWMLLRQGKFRDAGDELSALAPFACQSLYHDPKLAAIILRDASQTLLGLQRTL